jgi:GTP-binding protein
MTGRSPLAGLPIEFVGSFPEATVPLEPILPEIAFVGRSNVGKSSLLNALVGKKGLARVSGTPGKTQLLNVFRLPTFYLIDLPGYGWAKTSKAARQGFRVMLHGYLTSRPNLAGVVWLLDIRHPPSAEDHEVQELLVEAGRATLAVLTKADKLPHGQRLKAVRERARDLGVGPDDLLVTSSQTGLGMEDLGESILAALPRPV